MSAPPGKFDLASLTKSLKTHQGPDSPRLSQVVEKSESLSWKIEYQQESDQESTSASPLLQRRKQTPPMMMSRSLGKVCTKKGHVQKRGISKKSTIFVQFS